MSILSNKPTEAAIPVGALTWGVVRCKPAYAVGVAAGRVVEVRSDANFNTLLRTLPYSVYMEPGAGIETLSAIESTRRRPHCTAMPAMNARRPAFPPGTDPKAVERTMRLAVAMLPFADDDSVEYL